jgi:hypothetical protein
MSSLILHGKGNLYRKALLRDGVGGQLAENMVSARSKQTTIATAPEHI